MITMETSCIRCERIYAPSRDDVRRGTWRICPACRDGPDPDETGRKSTRPPSADERNRP